MGNGMSGFDGTGKLSFNSSGTWSGGGGGSWGDPIDFIRPILDQETAAEQIVRIEQLQELSRKHSGSDGKYEKYDKFLSDRLTLARQKIAAEQAAVQLAAHEAAQREAQIVAQRNAQALEQQRAATQRAAHEAVLCAAQEDQVASEAKRVAEIPEIAQRPMRGAEGDVNREVANFLSQKSHQVNAENRLKEWEGRVLHMHYEFAAECRLNKPRLTALVTNEQAIVEKIVDALEPLYEVARQTAVRQLEVKAAERVDNASLKVEAAERLIEEKTKQMAVEKALVIVVHDAAIRVGEIDARIACEKEAQKLGIVQYMADKHLNPMLAVVEDNARKTAYEKTVQYVAWAVAKIECMAEKIAWAESIVIEARVRVECEKLKMEAATQRLSTLIAERAPEIAIYHATRPAQRTVALAAARATVVHAEARARSWEATVHYHNLVGTAQPEHIIGLQAARAYVETSRAQEQRLIQEDPYLGSEEYWDAQKIARKEREQRIDKEAVQKSDEMASKIAKELESLQKGEQRDAQQAQAFRLPAEKRARKIEFLEAVAQHKVAVEAAEAEDSALQAKACLEADRLAKQKVDEKQAKVEAQPVQGASPSLKSLELILKVCFDALTSDEFAIALTDPAINSATCLLFLDILATACTRVPVEQNPHQIQKQKEQSLLCAQRFFSNPDNSKNSLTRLAELFNPSANGSPQAAADPKTLDTAFDLAKPALQTAKQALSCLGNKAREAKRKNKSFQEFFKTTSKAMDHGKLVSSAQDAEFAAGILNVEANAQHIDLAALPAAIRARIIALGASNAQDTVQQTMSI